MKKSTMGFFGEDNGELGRPPSGLGLYMVGILIVLAGGCCLFSDRPDRLDAVYMILLGIGVFLFGLWISRMPLGEE